MTPIKTGAWLWRDEYNDGVWCDLYRVGDCLVARVIANQEPVRGDKPDGLWATMHTCDVQFSDANGANVMHTWISSHFSIHYELQFARGGWHSVKIA